MNEEAHYQFKNCKNLLMALLAESFSSILNQEIGSDYIEYWLINSELAALGFEFLGVHKDYILPTIEKLKTGDFVIAGRTILRTREEQSKVHNSMSQGWQHRKKRLNLESVGGKKMEIPNLFRIKKFNSPEEAEQERKKYLETLGALKSLLENKGPHSFFGAKEVKTSFQNVLFTKKELPEVPENEKGLWVAIQSHTHQVFAKNGHNKKHNSFLDLFKKKEGK